VDYTSSLTTGVQGWRRVEEYFIGNRELLIRPVLSCRPAKRPGGKTVKSAYNRIDPVAGT